MADDSGYPGDCVTYIDKANKKRYYCHFPSRKILNRKVLVEEYDISEEEIEKIYENSEDIRTEQDNEEVITIAGTDMSFYIGEWYRITIDGKDRCVRVNDAMFLQEYSIRTNYFKNL